MTITDRIIMGNFKSAKEKRELLELKNYNNCLCFGNPKSNEYKSKFCKHCKKQEFFSRFNNNRKISKRECSLSDFVSFNDSFEAFNYKTFVTGDFLLLNYIDNINDFKYLNSCFHNEHILYIVNNLYNLLVENFDKELINKYIGFAMTNIDEEDKLIFYLYNKLENKIEYNEDTIEELEEIETDMCKYNKFFDDDDNDIGYNCLHSVLMFNLGNVDKGEEILEIKYAKGFINKETLEDCYKYSKTYTEYNPKVILKYIIKLLNLNNDNDIKKETRYSYYYKLK